MQEVGVRLFEGAYALKPKAEQRMLKLAWLGLALQAAFLVYIASSKTFSIHLLLVFALNLLVPLYFMVSMWLDRNPNYRRHLTLTEEGVRYRTRFNEAEQEFDWDEVDEVRLELFKVTFLLKNEAEHEINLERTQNDEVLRQLREQLQEAAKRKGLTLR